MATQPAKATGPVFAIPPEAIEVRYLTAGKSYSADSIPGDNEGFVITDDDGDRIYCLWVGCAHLDGDDWKRVEPDLAEQVQA